MTTTVQFSDVYYCIRLIHLWTSRNIHTYSYTSTTYMLELWINVRTSSTVLHEEKEYVETYLSMKRNQSSRASASVRWYNFHFASYSWNKKKTTLYKLMIFWTLGFLRFFGATRRRTCSKRHQMTRCHASFTLPLSPDGVLFICFLYII